MTAELLPYPFCGGEASPVTDVYFWSTMTTDEDSQYWYCASSLPTFAPIIYEKQDMLELEAMVDEVMDGGDAE